MSSVKMMINEIEIINNNILSNIVPVKLVKKNKKVVINTDINKVKLFNTNNPPNIIKNKIPEYLTIHNKSIETVNQYKLNYIKKYNKDSINMCNNKNNNLVNMMKFIHSK